MTYHVPLNLYRIKCEITIIKIITGLRRTAAVWDLSNLNIKMKLFSMGLTHFNV